MTFLPKIRVLKEVLGEEVIEKLYRLQVFTIILAVIEVAGISLLLPIIKLIGEDDDVVFLTLALTPLQAQLMLILVLITVVLFNLVGQAFVLRTASWIGGKLSERTFSATLNQNFSDIYKQPSSYWTNSIVNESARAAHQVIVPMVKLTGRFSFVLILIIVGNYHQPYLTNGFLLFLCLFYMAIFQYVRPRLSKSGKNISKTTEERIGLVANTYEALAELKIYRIEGEFKKIFREKAESFSNALGQSMILSALPRYIIEGFVGLIIGVAAIIMSLTQTSETDVASLVYLAVIFLRLLPASQETYQHIAALRTNWVALESCWRIISSNSSKRIKLESENDISGCSDRIELKIIKYGYPQTILKDIRLDFYRGELTTIVGESGCGKSTLIKILSGLILDYDGEVLLPESKIDCKKFKWSYVDQNVAILGNDLKYNITLGKPISENAFLDLINDCKLADTYKKIENMKKQKQDFELGNTLSGGERQRVAIARALCQQSDGYIFDEVTSALDVGTEQQMINAIKKYCMDKFCISVAHRPGFIEASSRKIVME